jgi:hypothetical protein
MPRAQDVAEARADVALSPLEANALAKTSQAVGGALKFVNVDLGPSAILASWLSHQTLKLAMRRTIWRCASLNSVGPPRSDVTKLTRSLKRRATGPRLSTLSSQTSEPRAAALVTRLFP